MAALLAICVIAGAGDGYQNLEWADFEGDVPNPAPDFGAETSMAWEEAFSGASEPDPNGGFKGTVKGGIHVTMDKASSWAKPSAKTPELLEHEQYHLDIHDLWGQLINGLLAQISENAPTAAEAASKATSTAHAVVANGMSLCQLVQTAYDVTTDHGDNAFMQSVWCATVGQWITPRDIDGSHVRVDVTGGVTGSSQSAAPSLQLPDFTVPNYQSPTGAVADSVLAVSEWRFPPMVFQSYFMGSPRARLFSPDGDRTVTLARGTAAPVLEGTLEHMIGDASGTKYRAWVSPVSVQARAANQSPFLGLVKANLKRRYALQIEIILPAPIESFTANWTQSANIPMQVRIGTAVLADPNDINLDGFVNQADVEPFWNLLAGTYPILFPWSGDANNDGVTNAADVVPFLAAVAGN